MGHGGVTCEVILAHSLGLQVSDGAILCCLFLSAQKKALYFLLTAHGLSCLVSVKLTQAEVI